MTKILLITTAAIELGAGLGLLAAPSAAAGAVFGSVVAEPSGVALGRLGGAALVALGVACALASRDARSSAANGLVAGMTLYNLGAVVILGAAGIISPPGGAILWPGVALHTAMTAWCVTCLLRK